MVAVLYTLIMITSAVINGQTYHYSLMTQQVWGQGCRSLILKKCFQLSNERQASTGQIITMIQLDVTIIGKTLNWALPLVGDIPPILVAFYMLYAKIGWYFLIIPIITVISIPFFTSLSDRVQLDSAGKLNQSDERVTLLTDILRGIKAVKMYGWTSIFKGKVLKIRETEINHLKLFNLNYSIQLSIAAMGTVLSSFVLFLVLGLTGNIQSPSTVFQMIQLISLVQFPISEIIDLYPTILQSLSSVDRIKALLLKESMEDYVIRDSLKNEAFSIENGIFSYENAEVLKNICIRVPKGNFIAVIGKVGSGKTSLLLALLGEIKKVTGKVCVDGSISYAAQSSWIMNQSIRENILIGEKMDEKRYTAVCSACDLYPDFKSLPNEDQTLVGPKGISLSGGQKARISLARALYSSSDVVLLDDPLSAVDAHVERHIVESLFGEQGLLKGKTVVLVTHAIRHLDKMDRVILMENGQISENGSYHEVMDLKGAVHAMVSEHLANQVQQVEQTTQNPESKTTEANILSNKAIEENVEERSTGTVSRGVYWYYIKCCGYVNFAIFVFLILIQCSMSNGTYYALSAWGKSDVSTAWFYFAIYSSLTFGVVVTTFGNHVYFRCFLSIKAANSIFLECLNKILRLPMSFFNKTPVGQILQRVDLDQDAVDNRIGDILYEYFQVAINVLVVGITLLLPSAWMIVILLVAGILFYFAQIISVPALREVMRLYALASAPINSLVTEILEGMQTIRGFGKGKQLLDKADKLRDTHARGYYHFLSTNRVSMIMMMLIAGLISSSIPFIGILVPDINPSLIGVAMINATALAEMLTSMILTYGAVETSMISLERIVSYKDLEEEAPSHTDYPLEKSWPKNGSVQIDNYSTAYDKKLDPVIRGLSVIIKGGEKVGIVGRTGAGKSSLTLSLFRLIEATTGKIIIDGVDINRIGLESLRSRLSILPQDAVVFRESIRNNLDPSGKIPDEQLWNALKASQMHDYVSQLPEKLDSKLMGDNGGLSHGQRQLLCLARAMIRNASILVLDEATSSIDHQTDQIIQCVIRENFQNTTILSIAHRISTIIDFDKIIVLDKGELAEFGSPKELLGNQNSLFYSLAKESGLV
ncbi:P-loop containing nucleoside triphosphate hydrolase protein [Globomyces pollinis-pini]|nr:P-loop containing nucleoside triphosphate hydrolase protein [Globomyces pollinis-pini]